MDVRPNIGLPDAGPIDLKITWPSRSVTHLKDVTVDQTLTVHEKDGTLAQQNITKEEPLLFKKTIGNFPFVHQENRFVDFDRDRLLHQMWSTQGPKMSMADVNGDGLKDIYIGGAKGYSGKLFLAHPDGYKEKSIPAFQEDKNAEDQESLFFDADNDGDLDLYVCSGGIEYSQFSSDYLDRLYMNDGNGNFKRSEQALPVSGSYHSTAAVSASDIDKDGDLDLFVGERLIPLKYGLPVPAFYWKMMERRVQGYYDYQAMALVDIGMITDGLFIDIDNDSDKDLIVVGEYMGIHLLENQEGIFTPIPEETLRAKKGWWNTLEAADLDGDGDIDFALGNHGQNTRFRLATVYRLPCIRTILTRTAS